MTATNGERLQVPRVGRWVVVTAITGTVLIGAGAFWLSFTTLSDLAKRAGIDGDRAPVWPLIVDGIIVVATVSVVALHPQGRRATAYPWLLLVCGTGVSVTANILHALVSAAADVPAVVAACVAAVPPLVLLAITHLTVLLLRATTPLPDLAASPVASSASSTVVPLEVVSRSEDLEPSGGRGRFREHAGRLRGEGWSNRAIARQFGVHPSTVGRWFQSPTSAENMQDSPISGEQGARVTP